MRLPLNRRRLFAVLTAASATACASTSARDEQLRASDPFRWGVASGDPDSTSVVLWTRLAPDPAAPGETVTWALARDREFRKPVATGEVPVRAGADGTVKTLVEGLAPGEIYYYRFLARGQFSIVGRTRTLPVGRTDRFGVALVSCSNYPFGYFNPYHAIASDAAVDLVLHTGDYIYEYGAGEWGDDVGAALGRRHDPAHETVTLDDYRRRHAQYKSDAGAQAMHAAHPFVACWDDHEVTNNPWVGGAQNHQSETEGAWPTRRAAALQAYYEWMPFREPTAPRTRADFWRVYRIGDLATLVTLETRHTGRGEQVDYKLWFDRIRTQDDRDAFMRDVIADPSRTMLSPAMEADLAEALTRSVAEGQPWRLLGNASPLARMLTPDVARLGIDPARNRNGATLGARPDLFWTGRWNLPFYTDTWDGYPAARERLYDLCRAAGAQDLVVLTGDSHSFWINALADANGRSIGVELGTAGVSSPGDFVESGWERESAERLDRIFEERLDEVVWTDNMHQGYVRVVLEREAVRGDFVAVDTVLTPDYRTRTLATALIERQPAGTLTVHKV